MGLPTAVSEVLWNCHFEGFVKHGHLKRTVLQENAWNGKWPFFWTLSAAISGKIGQKLGQQAR
eukprot:2513151-Amphidinium_carterae.1